MKKITLLSLVVATLLFTACDEKTKDAVSGVTGAVTDAVKESTSGAVDAAKKAAGDAADAAKAKAKEVVESAKAEAENVAAAAADKAAELKEAASRKAADAAQSLQDKVASATESARETASGAMDSVKDAAVATTAAAGSAVASETGNEVGKAAYAKCAGCHGADGKTKALGKSAVVAGQSAADLAAALTEYKAGTRNVSGMGTLMKGQVASMDDATIKAVSEYMSGL